VEEFRVLGSVASVETIAEGNEIRDLPRLLKAHGFGRWRKRKGIAVVELANGRTVRVELHWYEAYGIGQVERKIKRYLE
jgi:hypothetical protein